jgi:RNA polymerase sigma factor (sigma-70 family)
LLTSTDEDRIVREHEALARKVACKFVRQGQAMGLEFGDLMQHARIGLLRAARGFDPTRGVKFSSYAATAMQRHIRRALDEGGMVRVPSWARQAGAEAPSVLSLDFPATEEGSDTLGDLIVAEDDTQEQAISRVACEQLLSTLKEKERLAVRLYVGEELSLRQVARVMRCTPQNVSITVKKALAKLTASA